MQKKWIDLENKKCKYIRILQDVKKQIIAKFKKIKSKRSHGDFVNSCYQKTIRGIKRSG